MAVLPPTPAKVGYGACPAVRQDPKSLLGGGGVCQRRPRDGCGAVPRGPSRSPLSIRGGLLIRGGPVRNSHGPLVPFPGRSTSTGGIHKRENRSTGLAQNEKLGLCERLCHEDDKISYRLGETTCKPRIQQRTSIWNILRTLKTQQ